MGLWHFYANENKMTLLFISDIPRQHVNCVHDVILMHYEHRGYASARGVFFSIIMHDPEAPLSSSKTLNGHLLVIIKDNCL